MHTGWFAVDRELLASDLWLAEKFSRGQAWVDLIGLARFKPGYVRLRGKRVDLGIGQVAWSQRELARRWRWGADKVRAFLKELQTDGRIRFRSVGVTTVITMLCYEQLQPNRAPTASPIDTRASTQTGALTNTRTAHSPATKEPRQQSKQSQPPSEPTNVEGWRNILSILKVLGVAAAEPTLKATQARGLSPDEVQTVIDEYRSKPGAWGLGALVGRLNGSLPQWPPPSDDYLRQQRREAFQKSSERQMRERAQRRAEFQQQREAEAQLESQVGPLVDRLPPAELAGLETRAVPDASELALSRQCPAVHRNRLLAQMAEELKLEPSVGGAGLSAS